MPLLCMVCKSSRVLLSIELSNFWMSISNGHNKQQCQGRPQFMADIGKTALEPVQFHEFAVRFLEFMFAFVQLITKRKFAEP